jgi:anaerobic selenocysteine-containing dehydrogenase
LEKDVFETMEMGNVTTWKDFEDKKYYVYPTAKDWEKDSPGFRKFFEDPEKNPLPTPSGKLEFYSARLAKYFPDDKERPPSPQWIEKSETHDERLSSERACMFPLLCMSNHGRWRTHAQGDDITWTRETVTCKVLGADGYKYEPVWVNPKDAEKRDIKDGDIVKVFNERGVVMCGARVWERMAPGVVYVDHGARHDPIIDNVDRGGAINTIAPNGLTSKNACGQATSGYLVDVQKICEKDYETWRKADPASFDAAFKREYDPASGLRFNAWVEGGME